MVVKMTREEMKYAELIDEQSGRPLCPICKTPMGNAIDSITHKRSPYLWKTKCEHFKGIILNVCRR